MPNNWPITLIILGCNLLFIYNYFPIIYFWDIFKEDDLGKNTSKTGNHDLKKFDGYNSIWTEVSVKNLMNDYYNSVYHYRINMVYIERK